MGYHTTTCVSYFQQCTLLYSCKITGSHELFVIHLNRWGLLFIWNKFPGCCSHGLIKNCVSVTLTQIRSLRSFHNILSFGTKASKILHSSSHKIKFYLYNLLWPLWFQVCRTYRDIGHFEPPVVSDILFLQWYYVLLLLILLFYVCLFLFCLFSLQCQIQRGFSLQEHAISFLSGILKIIR